MKYRELFTLMVKGYIIMSTLGALALATASLLGHDISLFTFSGFGMTWTYPPELSGMLGAIIIIPVVLLSGLSAAVSSWLIVSLGLAVSTIPQKLRER